MIENYFKKGAKFIFNPQNQQPVRGDGKKQTTGIVKYPNRVSTITILPTLTGSNQLVRSRKTSYEWLPWDPGETSTLVLDKQDVITGPMSGCIISVWKEKKQIVVGHVGTTMNKKQSTAAKESFLKHLPTTATGFNPAIEWARKDYIDLMKGHKNLLRTPEVFAIVTWKGVGFAILALKLKDYYLCGGVRKVSKSKMKYNDLITKFAGIEKGKVKQLAKKLNMIQFKNPV